MTAPQTPRLSGTGKKNSGIFLYAEKGRGYFHRSFLVHGTKIGIAVSKDGGKWLYRGTLEGLDIEKGHNTFWAPEILWAEGCYHMYVSYITGIPTDWEYPRQMLHYTSDDLWDWEFQGRIDLNSQRVIDACVYEVAPHQYKMWYKDEEKESRTYAAVSSDLYHWEVLGEEVSDCAQEARTCLSWTA